MDKDYNFRLREIRGIVLMVILTLVIGLTSLFFYFYRLNNRFINYDEKSDVDYKVLLKDNEFYQENYLEKDKGYVSSLIDNIEAEFKYDLNFDRNIKYKYSYRNNSMNNPNIITLKNNNIPHFNITLYILIKNSISFFNYSTHRFRTYY